MKNLQRNYWRFYFNPTAGAILEFEPAGANGSGQLYPLEGGQPYFIPAGVRFHTRIATDIDHFYIHFDVIGIPNLAMSTLFNGPICLPWREGLVQSILEVAQQVRAANPVDLVLQCQIKAVIYEGLALYLKSLPAEQLQQPLQLAIALQPVPSAIHYIDANLANSLLNRNLAGLCQMNEDYFIRRFKECVG